MASYSEKLRDPRWQKKRLEIMQRDGFKCSECCDEKSTLHVHHTRYLKETEPWDYPNCLLTTLCEACHEALHSGVLSGVEYLQHIFEERGSSPAFLPCLGFAVEQVMDSSARLTANEWIECGRAFTEKIEEILGRKT
jgi:hypothetical protein